MILLKKMDAAMVIVDVNLQDVSPIAMIIAVIILAVALILQTVRDNLILVM